MCVQRSEEGVRAPGPGVTSDCEQSILGTENRTQVL